MCSQKKMMNTLSNKDETCLFFINNMRGITRISYEVSRVIIFYVIFQLQINQGTWLSLDETTHQRFFVEILKQKFFSFCALIDKLPILMFYQT